MDIRMGPHFHTSLYDDGECFYDFNDELPVSAIRQFAAVIDGVVFDADYKGICNYVSEKFLENEKLVDDGETYSISLGTTELGATITKCWGPCLVSPNMN